MGRLYIYLRESLKLMVFVGDELSYSVIVGIISEAI